MTSAARSTGLLRSSRGLSRVGIGLIAITIAAAGLAIGDLRREAIEDYQRDTTNLGVVLAEQTSRTMQAVDLVVAETRVRILAAGVETPDQFKRLTATEDMHEFLVSQLKSLPQADAIELVDIDGRVVNFSRRWPVPEIDVSGRDYWRDIRPQHGDQPSITTPVKARVTGAWTFYLARRVTGLSGEFLGVVMGAIQVPYLEAFYEAITLDEGTSVAVLRRDGTFLLHYPYVEAMMGLKLPPGSPWHDRVEASGGTIRLPGYPDGIEEVVSIHPLRDYPLVVDVAVSEAAALAHWRRQSLLIALGALCAAVAFAVLFRALAAQFRRLEGQTAELVRGEEALRLAKEEAEAASRTKSQFLANMSHELRTPLNAIIGFSEVIRDAIMGPVDPRYGDYARDIHMAGQHLLSLISDVLDLSKIEVGRLKLHEEPVSIAEVIDTCRRLVAERAREGGVALEEAVPSDLPPVFADRLRLKQIVLNVLANAVKFTRPGGRVRIAASLPAEGGLVLSITDTGIGMAPEDIPTALTPFGQVEDALHRRYDGTGLGLPLAKMLAERHGGTLAIESQIGVGTSVRIRLPEQRLHGSDPLTLADVELARI